MLLVIEAVLRLNWRLYWYKLTCSHFFLTNFYLPVFHVSSSDRWYSAFCWFLSRVKVTRTQVCDERVYLFHTDGTNCFAVRNLVNPGPFYVPPPAYQSVYTSSGAARLFLHRPSSCIYSILESFGNSFHVRELQHVITRQASCVWGSLWLIKWRIHEPKCLVFVELCAPVWCVVWRAVDRFIGVHGARYL
jgi:hypothetical protein